jgi:hypothetical protein
VLEDERDVEGASSSRAPFSGLGSLERLEIDQCR